MTTRSCSVAGKGFPPCPTVAGGCVRLGWSVMGRRDSDTGSVSGSRGPGVVVQGMGHKGTGSSNHWAKGLHGAGKERRRPTENRSAMVSTGGMFSFAWGIDEMGVSKIALGKLGTTAYNCNIAPSSQVSFWIARSDSVKV